MNVMHAAGSAARPSPPARRTLAIVAGSVLGLAGLVVGALALGLVVAVRLADEGRVTVDPDDLAVARVLAGYAPVIGALAAAHLVASVGIAMGRGWARLLGVAVATAGAVALAWTIVPSVAGFGIGALLDGDAAAGLGIVVTLVGVYAIAASATVASSDPRGRIDG
jgi:hypothetical protein